MAVIRVFLQIEDGDPFYPDDVITFDILMGTRETTKQGDRVKNFVISSGVALVHFHDKGLEIKDYYASGAWTSHEGSPIFKVSGLLKYPNNKESK